MDVGCSETSRRGLVLAQLAPLMTSPAALAELFLVLLGPVLLVLSERSLESKVASRMHRAHILRGSFQAVCTAQWWDDHVATARWGRKDRKECAQALCFQSIWPRSASSGLELAYNTPGATRSGGSTTTLAARR